MCSAVAKSDTDAMCAISTGNVTSPDGDDVCGTDEQDDLVTCGDAAAAVGALTDEAITVGDTGTVTIAWDPEMAPECGNGEHAPRLPREVRKFDGRWQVREVAPAG